MKKPGQNPLYSWNRTAPGASEPAETSVTKVRRHRGFLVHDFPELVCRVAQLSFANPDYVLFFRGQRRDYRNNIGKSRIKPTIFRSVPPSIDSPNSSVIRARYTKLASAERRLVDCYRAHGFIGLDRVERFRILRWAILQHYEVCDTPLVDVSHSLRVAASFASESGEDEAFIMALGLPNLAGSVTASSEEGVQIIRLSSICPPQALRPHFQEGYLVGEYPEIDSIDQKANFAAYEVDVARRLVAKFRFNPKTFWTPGGDFPPIPRWALYPDSGDPFFKAMKQITETP